MYDVTLTITALDKQSFVRRFEFLLQYSSELYPTTVDALQQALKDGNKYVLSLSKNSDLSYITIDGVNL